MNNTNKEQNPWHTISTREIYQNKWMRLREDQIISPGGIKGIYGVVETTPAIAIVPLTIDLKTYLVGQFRYPLNEYSWEVPEGSADQNESNIDAAKRELREETGLIAGKWTYLDSIFTSNSITNESGHIYLAEDLEPGPSNPEHTEDLEIKIVPFLEAYRRVQNFEIKDALAIIGIMRVYQLLKKEGRL